PVSRNWGTIGHPRPGPGQSAPVQGRLLGAPGPATDRTTLRPTPARRAATERGRHSASAYINKYVAAPAGVAIAILFIVPVALGASSSAHADTGMNGYLRCIDSAGVPPRQNAEDWSPTIKVIERSEERRVGKECRAG